MTPPWKWPRNCKRSSWRGSETSAFPGVTARMRNPAARPKPLALTASARLGGLRALFKRKVCSRWNAHRQGLDAADEAGKNPLRLTYDLDPIEALEHLLPHDFQLQFGKPHADAAVDAEAERQMGAGPGAVDDEVVGILDHLFVAITRDVPHHDAVAFPDGLAAKLGIFKRCAPHMRQRRLPANDLRYHGIDQRRIVAQLLVLIGVFVQREHRAAHGVAGGVVAADDQQDDVAHQIV